jgi:hypothetical protein
MMQRFEAAQFITAPKIDIYPAFAGFAAPAFLDLAAAASISA